MKKSVFITGATNGTGYAIAERFAKEGYDVFIGSRSAENSQAVIGVQMASAYVGICLMPPLFGLIANHISVSLLPVYLAVILVLMVAMHELLIKRCPVKMR